MKIRRYFMHNCKRAIDFLPVSSSLLDFIVCFETTLAGFIIGFISGFNEVLKRRIMKQ